MIRNRVVITGMGVVAPNAIGLKNFLEAIKKGDEILTSGGIIAKVTKADGEKLNVDIAPNVNVVVYRSTVADVINKK